MLLETNPGDPYSVTIWGVGLQDRFYIAAGNRSSRWAENISADARVNLDVDGKLYAAFARQVSDPQTLAIVGNAFVAKYDIERDEGFYERGAIYQLSPTP